MDILPVCRGTISVDWLQSPVAASSFFAPQSERHGPSLPPAADRSIPELMNSITMSLFVAACVLAGGLVGLFLHRFLPRGHLPKDTQDVVRLGTGMLSVLASLVLGLLIATAKSSYDTVDHNLRSY